MGRPLALPLARVLALPSGLLGGRSSSAGRQAARQVRRRFEQQISRSRQTPSPRLSLFLAADGTAPRCVFETNRLAGRTGRRLLVPKRPALPLLSNLCHHLHAAARSLQGKHGRGRSSSFSL